MKQSYQEKFATWTRGTKLVATRQTPVIIIHHDEMEDMIFEESQIVIFEEIDKMRGCFVAATLSEVTVVCRFCDFRLYRGEEKSKMSKPEVGRKYKVKMADQIRGLCVGDVLTLTGKYSDGPHLITEFDNDEHAFVFGPDFVKTFDDWFELVEEPEMSIDELLSKCRGKNQKLMVHKDRLNPNEISHDTIKYAYDSLQAVDFVHSINGNTTPNTRFMEEIDFLKTLHKNLMEIQPKSYSDWLEWLELHGQTTNYLAHKITQDALGYEICERQMLETLCVMFAEKWNIERFQTFSTETTDLLLMNIMDLMEPNTSMMFEGYGLTVAHCSAQKELVFVVGCELG